MKQFLKKYYLKISCLILIIVGAVILIEPMGALAQTQQTFSRADNGWLLAIFGNLFLAVINALGSYILLPLINMVVQVFSYNAFSSSHAIIVGWPLVRDVCNMFFVVILLLIAFSTILHYHAYEYKEALPRLILMAIVINFSKTIMLLLIDFGQVVMLTFVNAFQHAAANNLVNAFGLTDMLKINLANGASTKISDWEVFASLFLAIILLIVAIGVMLAYAAVLLYRIFVLWVLIILSPIAFFLSAFEAGEHYAKEFWEKFWSQLTTGVVMAFFMWLALTILSASYTDPSKSLTQQAGLLSTGSGPTPGQVQTATGSADGGATGIASWDKFYTFIITIALLMIALEFAEKAGGFAGAFAGKVAGKLEGMAVGHSGPLKRFRTAWEGYTKAKDARHHEKYSAWGYKLADMHGTAESKIGGLVGKPFQAARAGIARITGFKQYEEDSKKTKEKQEKLKEAAGKRKEADKIDKALTDGKVVGEDEQKRQAMLRDVLRAEADQIEKDNGLTDADLKPERIALTKKLAEKEIKENEDLLAQEQAKEGGGDRQKKESYSRKIEAAKQRVQNMDYIASGGPETQKIQLSNLNQQLEEAKKENDQPRVDALTAGIKQLQGNITSRSSGVLSTKDFLDEQHKEQAKTYLGNKYAKALFWSKSNWENKATVASELAGTYSNMGNVKDADRYSALSKRYNTLSKVAAWGTGAAGVAVGGFTGLAPIALVPLGAKTAKWFANTSVTQGGKLSHMAKDFQFAEVKKEMKEMEDLDPVELKEFVDDKHKKLSKVQRIAAILEYLRQGQSDSSLIEDHRLTLGALGADGKTKAYLEKLIQQQYPNFGHLHKVEDGIPLSRQIELGMINVKELDSSVFKARRGEMAWETVLNLKFAAVMDMSKRSKAVEDNIVEGLEMKFEDMKADGSFDDASKWGDLSKVLTRYFAVGKKDAKFEEIFMNAKGEVQHLGLLRAMSQNKDFQNVVAFTRFDKIMDKLPESARQEFMGNVILKSHTGEIIPALTMAAQEGDAPSQESAQRLIDYIADIKNDESGAKEKAAIAAGLRGFKEGTTAYNDEKKKLQENLDQLWKSLRESSVARSGRMKDLFDWRKVPQPDLASVSRSNKGPQSQASSQGPSSTSGPTIVSGTAENFEEARRNRKA